MIVVPVDLFPGFCFLGLGSMRILCWFKSTLLAVGTFLMDNDGNLKGFAIWCLVVHFEECKTSQS